MTNKEIVIQFSKKFWEQQDITAVDKYVSEHCVIHTPLTMRYGSLTLKEIARKWFDAFPDLLLFWRDFIAEDDKVVCRWRAKGTHLGSFFETRPTHEEISFIGVTTYRIEDGIIKEYWSLIDIHTILKQLGCYQSMSEVVD